MRHRNGVWASTAAAVAAAALLGCSSGDDTGGSNTIAGSGGTPPGAPMVMGGAATGAPMMMMNPATAGGMGGGGAVMPPAAAGTTGAMAAGSSAAGAAAAGAAAAGSGGSMAPPTAGSTADPDAGTTPPPAMAGSCGPENTNSPVDLGDPMKLGPWKPTMKASSGPSGQSTLFYPMELGKDGVKHPVFHWGCGAGSTPSQYADHLNLLASQGFVVIANASGSNPEKASIDWLLAENDKMGSMFYQKLDPKRVGIGGHSLGALETFQSAADPRATLYVLVCGGSGSGTTGAADIHGPSIFLGGEGEGGTTNFQQDYAAITKASSIFITKTDTDHIYCARNNLAPWVAFMRWNFCGEDKYKKEFMPDGTYCKSPWLACMTKGL